MATENTPQDDTDDRLLSIKETARKLGYTYRSFSQARSEGRVLLEAVCPSDGGRGVKYRLSDVNRVMRGETKALRAILVSPEDKKRIHARTRALRAERKPVSDE